MKLVHQYTIGVHYLTQERDLSSVEILEALNSLVACGELPTLFSNDEMDGLLQVAISN